MRYHIAPLSFAEPAQAPASFAPVENSGGGTASTESTSASQAGDAPRPPLAPKHARCSVCSLVLRSPVAPPCGHAICAQCLPSTANNKICCPTCAREFLASCVKPASMISWLLGGVRVRCLAPGCAHECDRSSIDAHTVACPCVLVGCPHEQMGCRARVARGDLSAHLGGCAFESCQSFMASTLRRLQALEEDNRQLRTELTTLRTSVRWIELTTTVKCADCHDFYIPSSEEPAEAAGLATPVASSAGPSAESMPTPAADVAAAGTACAHQLGSADPKTLFRPWPSSRSPTTVAATEAGAAQDAGRKPGALCAKAVCGKHRRDEEWYREWRQRKCRFLLDSSGLQHPNFPAFMQQ